MCAALVNLFCEANGVVYETFDWRDVGENLGFYLLQLWKNRVSNEQKGIE